MDRVRESIPKQVDKKSGGPRGERTLGLLKRRKGSGVLRRRKGQTFFSLHSLVLVTEKVFFFKPRTDNYTMNNSV